MRTSGVLMPISSIPSPYGIGTMGKQARKFVDFLVKGGQKYWQILPICPTSYGDSPYQSFSSFAGNPYFIDLEYLCKDKLRFYQIHPQINIDMIKTTYSNQSTERQILEILLNLPPKYKEVLLLHYVEGYKCHEICRILNITESTVKKRLERGRNLLKKNLEVK